MDLRIRFGFERVFTHSLGDGISHNWEHGMSQRGNGY